MLQALPSVPWCRRTVDASGGVSPASFERIEDAGGDSRRRSRPRQALTTSIELLAPIALYPDALLAQILLCAAKPAKVAALNEWMAANPTLKGSDLQEAATKSGFDQSFAALVLFPDVVAAMASRTRVDDAPRRSVRGRPLGGLYQHPAAAQKASQAGQAEEHAAAGRRDQDDVER